MKLYLVQHGDAVPKEQDPERPLSDAGYTNVARLGAFLGGRIEAARVLHSGKPRARQTAELLATAIAPDQLPEIASGINPNDPVPPFVERIQGFQQDIIIVGHLPFLAKLVAHLVTGSDASPVVAFQPGAMVCLESEDGKKWVVQWMIRPELC